uniref:BPI2 domain-containing protein n=1 Tax=Globodera pallida TaxID=36090 RepID=A0A183C5T1_GLOPA
MVRVIFDGSNLRLDKFYQQTGSGPIAYFEGLPTFQRGYGYFLGVPRQKGAGVGAVLRNLWRYLRPMISAAKPYAANIAAELGKEGLETGARVLNQVSKGGDIKDAMLAEGKDGIHPITSYIDLSKVFVSTEFKIKKIAEDGVLINIDLADSVGLIQMPEATFIRNLKVHINQREVYDSNQLYSYNAYLDTELSYPIAAKDSYFGVAGYFRDSDLSKPNDKRKKPLAESKAYQTISKLSADIFNQDLYMISNVEIDIELALQSDDFMLHQEKDKEKFVLEIVDCRLIVKTVDLMDGLSLDIARKLDVEPARYGIRKSFMKSLFITGGRYDFSANLFTEEVPRRVIIGLVANQNYIGHKQKNPFYFNHHNNRKNGLSYSMFKTAFCLYVFQMTNSQEDSPGFELIKEGCTAVNIRFSEPVPPEGVTLIAYGEADGLILIDRNRIELASPALTVIIPRNPFENLQAVCKPKSLESSL